jgi:hypothetical protein
MTARCPRPNRVLPDDGIIDPIAVEIAVGGTRLVALTPAERVIAAAAILARGGTPYLVSKRLHVSGSTAIAFAAKYHQQPAAQPREDSDDQDQPQGARGPRRDRHARRSS